MEFHFEIMTWSCHMEGFFPSEQEGMKLSDTYYLVDMSTDGVLDLAFKKKHKGKKKDWFRGL